MKVKVKTIKCKRCEHEWVPRSAEIRKCPKCQSPWFDKEKECSDEQESQKSSS